MLRLVTIPISHYCEKARWALDRAALPYREERHVQAIHVVAARRAGGRRTVPVLVTPERVLAESSEIVEWADERTIPDRRTLPADTETRSDVQALCRRFDDQLGPAGRRLIYVHMLPQRHLALEYNNAGVPGWEDRAITLGWPVAVAVMHRALGITPGVEIEDEKTVYREFDFAAELLADGRPYLCGERFTAADLTFSALAAPVIVPREYGVPLPQPDVLPPATAAMVSRAREHPAGRHALAMFAQHRRG